MPVARMRSAEFVPSLLVFRRDPISSLFSLLGIEVLLVNFDTGNTKSAVLAVPLVTAALGAELAVPLVSFL